MSSHGRSLPIRNILANWGAFAFSAVASFFLSPFVVHKLGDEAYGAWALLVGLVGYMGLLDLGVRSAVTRYIARFHAEGNHEEASRVASAALSIFCLAGLFAIALSAGFATFIGSLFNIPPELVPPARIVAVVGGVTVATSLIGGVFGGVLVGVQRLDLNNAVDVACEAVRMLAIYFALRAGEGLVVLAGIQLVITVVRTVAAFGISRLLYPQLRVHLAEWSPPHLRLILSFSIAAFLMQASGMLIAYSDSLIIGGFLPIAMVTFFSISISLTNYARTLVSGVSQAVAPLVSSLETSAGYTGVTRTLLKGAQMATAIALPMVITFMLRGSSFITLWMGESYAAQSQNVLWVLSLALWFAAGYQVNTATMMGIGKHRGLVPVFIVEAVVNVTLSIVLVQRFGLPGVAWGIAGPRLVVCLLVGPWYARKMVGVRIRDFWNAVWIRPSLAFVPFGVVSFLVERFWPAPNLLVYFLQIAVTLPVGAIGVWYVCLTRGNREEFGQRLLQPFKLVMGRS